MSTVDLMVQALQPDRWVVCAVLSTDRKFEETAHNSDAVVRRRGRACHRIAPHVEVPFCERRDGAVAGGGANAVQVERIVLLGCRAKLICEVAAGHVLVDECSEASLLLHHPHEASQLRPELRVRRIGTKWQALAGRLRPAAVRPIVINLTVRLSDRLDALRQFHDALSPSSRHDTPP
jgi:hypothetical protein